MPALPDLTGQPGWVVVVVAVLMTLGSIGAAWLRRGSSAPDGESEDETARPVEPGAVPSLPAAPHDGATLAIQKALDHLAAEAAESREARAETATTRKELETVRGELIELRRLYDEARRALVGCEARAELLARQAEQRGHHG